MTLVLTRAGLRAGGRVLRCTVGRAGIVPGAAKREGDGATPAGAHRITGCLYRPDRMRAPSAWARPLAPGDIWSDDPNDPAYNRLGRAPSAFSHEILWREDALYDLILTTDWNGPDAKPGRGSAIFLHRWRAAGVPTAGCLAFAPADLVWLARRAPPGTRLVIPGARRDPADPRHTPES